MTTLYTVVLKTTLPRHLTARVLVQRVDGGELSAEDLTDVAALWPPAKGPRTGLRRAVTLAPPRTPAPKGKAPKRSRAPKAAKAPAKASKRAAAKRR